MQINKSTVKIIKFIALRCIILKALCNDSTDISRLINKLKEIKLNKNI